MWSKQTTLWTNNTGLFFIKSKLFWLWFVLDGVKINRKISMGYSKGMNLHRQKLKKKYTLQRKFAKSRNAFATMTKLT